MSEYEQGEGERAGVGAHDDAVGREEEVQDVILLLLADVLEEEVHELEVAGPGGGRQRGVAGGVAEVNGGAALEEDFEGIVMLVSGG